MKKTISFLISLIFLSSCSEEIPPISGDVEVNYYISDYFIPQNIGISTYSRNGVFDIILGHGDSSISQKGNFVEFKKLAKEYGETGEKTFILWHPSVSHPYSLSTIRVYKMQNGKMIDLSEQSWIGYSNYSKFILSKYLGEDCIFISKKISEVTSDDLKWLPKYFSVSPPMEDKGEYYLTISLTSGKELSVLL